MKTTIRRSAGILASSAMMLLATHASADSDDPGELVTESYCIPEMSSTQGGFLTSDRVENGGTLRLHGSAEITPDGVLELTNVMSGGDDAAAYYTDPLKLDYIDGSSTDKNQPFAVYFSFSIGPNIKEKERGAGLAFLVQNNKDNDFKTGGNGESIGYGGIEPSMVIEFDTEWDVPPGGTATLQDPSEEHVGFMLDGDSSEHVAYHKHPQRFTSVDTKKWHVWIEYTGMDTDDVNVYLSETEKKPSTPISWQLNPAPMFSALFPDDFDAAWWLSVDADGRKPKGYFGLTAANYGSRTNNHQIYEWEFSNVGIPCACQGESACPTSLPACSSGVKTKNHGICVECTEGNTAACDAAGKVCDTDAEECVDCIKNSDCFNSDKGPVCNLSLHTCEPCKEDADCNGNPQGSHCALSGADQGKCVPDPKPCEDGCPDDTICNPKTGICDPNPCNCLEGFQCNAMGVCEPLPCNACPAGWVCDEALNGCVPPCDEAKECPDGYVCDVAAKRCDPQPCGCAPGHMCDTSTRQCLLSEGTIEGGGCACTAAGSQGSEGLLTGLTGVLGAAAVVARRRRRSAKHG